MNDDTPAIRLDSGSVARCRFPILTADRVERMSKAAFSVMADRGGWPASEEMWATRPETREDWYACAKAMYACLALDAGARPEGVPDPDR